MRSLSASILFLPGNYAPFLVTMARRLRRTNQRVDYLMKKRARLASRGARSRVVNRLTGRLEKAWALQAKLKQAITKGVSNV